jgi:hypothetical protein
MKIGVRLCKPAADRGRGGLVGFHLVHVRMCVQVRRRPQDSAPRNCFWAPKTDSLYGIVIQHISWAPITVLRARIASTNLKITGLTQNLGQL